MSDEAADKAAADAQRLLDCDGPHLRKWMSDDPLDFIATVHRVAAWALVPRETIKPEPVPAQSHVPEEAPRPRAPATRPLRKG